VQYFRELQSLLQQFIIVEHAVEPAADAASSDQQQLQAGMDHSTVEAAMKQESEAVTAADESAMQTEPLAEHVSPVDMPMMDTPADPSAMETSSSADNEMAFEQDQQPSAEPFITDKTGSSDIAWRILSTDLLWLEFSKYCITDSELARPALLMSRLMLPVYSCYAW